jgi:uncharacterized oxidoreductase
MKTSGNKVLITGGGTGIGLALAEALLKEGNEVLVCGRREEKLREAQRKNPALIIKTCDISQETDRKALLDLAAGQWGVNVLVNNAGMQRMIDFKKGTAELMAGDNEVRINLEAPIYLTAMMIPHLLAQKEAAIVNVSSGLGFVPMAIMPVYCATKAAIHSFTVSLRHQLKTTSIKVFEAIPPTVDTELDRGARAQRGQTDRGITSQRAAAEILQGLKEDRYEVAIAGAQNIVQASRQNFDQIFQRMNSR